MAAPCVRKVFSCVVISLMSLLPIGAEAATTRPSAAEAKQLSPAEIYEKVSPSVVKIDVLDEDGKVIGQGSGFVVYCARDELDKGVSVIYVVTNYHVIRNAVDLRLSSGDQRFVCATHILTEDAAADLAVLLVEVHSQQLPPEVPEAWRMRGLTEDDLGRVTLRAIESPRVGDRVFTIGSPKGLANTLSEGLISGFRKTKGQDWIQISAPLSPGSSGGPLLNSAGQVVGVTTASISEGQSLNFAIPASEVERVLQDKHQGREIWSGVSIRKAKEGAYSTTSFVMRARFARRHNSKKEPFELVRPDAPEFLQYILSGEKADQRMLLAKGYYQYQSKNCRAAIETLQKAIDTPMADDEVDRILTSDLTYLACFTLGEVHYQLEQERSPFGPFDKTIEALKQASKAKPDFAPTHLLLAQCYLREEKYLESLLEAETLVRLVPRCADAYATRGYAYEKLKRYEEALKDFMVAVDLRPTDSDSSFHAGDMYSELGRHGEALRAFEAAATKTPPDGAVHFFRWLCFDRIARTHLKLGNVQQAIAASEEALKVLQQMEDSPVTRQQIARQRDRIATCQRLLTNK